MLCLTRSVAAEDASADAPACRVTLTTGTGPGRRPVPGGAASGSGRRTDRHAPLGSTAAVDETPGATTILPCTPPASAWAWASWMRSRG